MRMDEVTAVSNTLAISHTTGRMTDHIEVVNRVSGRRRWTLEQKLAILHDAFGPKGSLRAACERHDLSAAQLYSWRRQVVSGELTHATPAPTPAFAAVEVAAADGPAASAAAWDNRINIELPSGVRLSIDPGVDPQALARVLSVLRP